MAGVRKHNGGRVSSEGSLLHLPHLLVTVSKPGGRNAKPVGFEGKLLNLHVLLVDDESAIRKMAVKFLNDLGCTSCVLEDGDLIEEALQKTTRPFDSIFLDIIMPRTDGAVVCERLRSLYQVRPRVNRDALPLSVELGTMLSVAIVQCCTW
jgi:CheY-like chemotaxis protein